MMYLPSKVVFIMMYLPGEVVSLKTFWFRCVRMAILSQFCWKQFLSCCLSIRMFMPRYDYISCNMKGSCKYWVPIATSRWCWWILWTRTRIRGCQSPQCGQHIRACWIPLKAKRCDFSSSTTILLHKLHYTQVEVTRLERFEFYKQAKEAYAVVHTGETALYGNIILQKGVLRTWYIVTISGHKVTGI